MTVMRRGETWSFVVWVRDGEGVWRAGVAGWVSPRARCGTADMARARAAIGRAQAEDGYAAPVSSRAEAELRWEPVRSNANRKTSRILEAAHRSPRRYGKIRRVLHNILTGHYVWVQS